MRRDKRSAKLGIRTISDLRKHPELRFGLTHEFLARQDGWRPLAERYQLNPQNVIGIDHALGYAALKNGSIDVKDAYSTDAKIAEYDLVTLEDDRQFFPRYDAVFLFRFALPTAAISSLRKLEGTLDEQRMIRLNAEAERTKDYRERRVCISTTAQDRQRANPSRTNSRAGRCAILELGGLLIASFGDRRSSARDSRQSRRRGWTRHSRFRRRRANYSFTRIACVARSAAIFWNQRTHRDRRAFSLRTSPDRAQHRHRFAGHPAIDCANRRSRLGLEPGARLRKIYLPIASRSILAGIKTSAVINIGTATLAALIGAGGLGEPILSGLNLNDHVTILQGAIPAAVLALLVQWLFDLLDRVLIPKGLRL